MDPITQETLRAAEAVSSLVEACRSRNPAYRRSSRALAQVSRTGKWLLHALARLRRDLTTPPNDETKPQN
jgi:hypothetical protein